MASGETHYDDVLEFVTLFCNYFDGNLAPTTSPEFGVMSANKEREYKRNGEGTLGGYSSAQHRTTHLLLSY